MPRETRFRLLAGLCRAVQIGLLGSLRKVSTVYFMRFPLFPSFAWRKDDIFGMNGLQGIQFSSSAQSYHSLRGNQLQLELTVAFECSRTLAPDTADASAVGTEEVNLEDSRMKIANDSLGPFRQDLALPHPVNTP